MTSLAHVIMAEEAMVYAHQVSEKVSALDMFTRINLDLSYNAVILVKPMF